MSTLTTPQPRLEGAADIEIAAPVMARSRWSFRSIAIIVFAWLVLQFGGIFSPGLLDDVDSIYIQIAHEMMRRHDYVTPYIDGIRFFDKPPLMYWMASAAMRVFGVSDWAARLPLALGVLALLFSVYALGNRLFAPANGLGAEQDGAPNDRGGFYSALALATAIGPYLYTRFFIPDILIALWMTLGVHLFLIALQRVQSRVQSRIQSRITTDPGAPQPALSLPKGLASEAWVSKTQDGPAQRSALLPCLGFAAVMALNILTKGLIGAVFSIGFVLLYLAITRKLHLLPRFHLLASLAVFLAIAAPWHILAALRNPAIALPADLGLPARGGWAWFYLYNEHIARFLSKRIPHDYGQTPVWLFWLYNAIWTMPWTAFLPGAFAAQFRALRNRDMRNRALRYGTLATARQREAALAPMLWALLVLGFFSISARQEYYGLPAIPALCLMAGGQLGRAERDEAGRDRASSAARGVLRWSTWFLAPVTAGIALVCGYFAVFAPRPPRGAALSDLLLGNPALYNLSLGHLFDLTGAAMGIFRGPLAAVAIGMLTLGVGSTLLRRKGRQYAANLTVAGGMMVALLGAHAGLTRFYPILGSKDLAIVVNDAVRPADMVMIDGELTVGSSLIFYTARQAHLVDGRVNGPWYGSFWPDSPAIFETDSSLRAEWPKPRRIFLLTGNPASRLQDLARFGTVRVLATSGGKSILTNQ